MITMVIRLKDNQVVKIPGFVNYTDKMCRELIELNTNILSITFENENE